MSAHKRPAGADNEQRSGLGARLYQQRYLFFFLLPGLIWFILICYTPMAGIIIAFKDYSTKLGFLGSPWIGLKYFRQFFHSPWFSTVLVNTIGISLIKLVFFFPVPIIFALLLNELPGRKFKRTVQTVSYMPHFISWVVTLAIFGKLLSIDGGLVNQIILRLGGHPINFFSEPGWMWPLAYITEAWKETGWEAIIYLAALTSLDPEVGEAAMVDGAGKLKRIVYISLPGIMNTIVVLLIIRIGFMLSANFDQMYILGRPATYDTAEVIDTYVYRNNLVNGQYSLGTAVGLLRSAVNVLLVLGANKLTKAFAGYGLF